MAAAASTSSEAANVSCTPASGSLSSACGFSKVSNASAARPSTSSASAACCPRRRPSKENGRVATATASAPWFFARVPRESAPPRCPRLAQSRTDDHDVRSGKDLGKLGLGFLGGRRSHFGIPARAKAARGFRANENLARSHGGPQRNAVRIHRDEVDRGAESRHGEPVDERTPALPTPATRMRGDAAAPGR